MIIHTVAAALSAMIVIAPTSDEGPALTRTVAVGYGDLDLSRPAGRATLKRRVRTAITTACGTAETLTDFRTYIATRRCKIDAAAMAARQVGVAVAKAKTGTEVAFSTR